MTTHATPNGEATATVSVALCTYNGAAHIDAQLASIFNQTRLPDELIASDDGSDDDTVARLNRAARSAPLAMRVVLGAARLGVTRNFERAIGACTGSVIVLADQDDLWAPNKVQRIVDAFSADSRCGYVFSDASLIDAHDAPVADSLWARIGFAGYRMQRYQAGKQLPVLLRGGNFVYGMALAFRSIHRGLLLPITATSADCTHDTWIATLLSAAGHHGQALPERLVAYRQHAHQVVGAGHFDSTSLRAVRQALAGKRRAAQALADDYAALAQRLREAAPRNTQIEEAHKLVADKALHLRQRQAVIESPRWARLPRISKELSSGRYARYSTSWISALRDLTA